ncbi:hypothetical protein EI94DRAFT_1739913 [Lactarius quietus]|nr:hypothetical protein EI94DRAFT_1739913 [Lactarius quietus]
MKARRAPLVLPVAVAADVVVTPVTVGVVSLSELDAFPRIALAKEHTSRMLFTSDGRSVVFRMAVWFSTHCGKTDWKVDVSKAVEAAAQELMLG